MWYRLAEQGLLNPKLPNGEDAKAVLERLILDSYDGDKLNFEKLNQKLNSSPLKAFISKIGETRKFRGVMYLESTEMLINPTLDKRALISMAKHELIHNMDPKTQGLKIPYSSTYADETWKKLKDSWSKVGRDPEKYFDVMETTAWASNMDEAFGNKESLNRIYKQFYKDIPNGKEVFNKDLKMFINAMSQWGKNSQNAIEEINAIEKKIGRKFYGDYAIYEKYGIDFETIDKWIKMSDVVNREDIDKAILGIKDPKFYQQFIKRITPEYSQRAIVPEKNLNDFLSKAKELETLAEQNPNAWNKFINQHYSTRLISSNVYNIFKNIGNKAVQFSQSLKGLNLSSPFWQLAEPAIEFGLYQFGLFLENPNTYQFSRSFVDEQNKLKKMIDEDVITILTDPKVKNKLAYFNKYILPDLKKLPVSYQEEIYRKMGYARPQSKIENLQSPTTLNYNKYQEIAKNIGKK